MKPNVDDALFLNFLLYVKWALVLCRIKYLNHKLLKHVEMKRKLIKSNNSFFMKKCDIWTFTHKLVYIYTYIK